MYYYALSLPPPWFSMGREVGFNYDFIISITNILIKGCGGWVFQNSLGLLILSLCWKTNSQNYGIVRLSLRKIFPLLSLGVRVRFPTWSGSSPESANAITSVGKGRLTSFFFKTLWVLVFNKSLQKMNEKMFLSPQHSTHIHFFSTFVCCTRHWRKFKGYKFAFW